MLVSRDPADFSRPCVLVPTMGALHAGHVALIERGARLARERGLAGGCVATIFVNPTQFNDPSDFARYPRTPEADHEVCRRAGASGVFEPTPERVYPAGESVPVPPLPALASEPGLEDRFRPGHFAGVAQVVLRLFELLRPAAAVFGEKDWQQLQLVRSIAPLAASSPEIVAGPTVREADGLAMSSRNLLLSPEARRQASAVPAAIRAARREAVPSEAEDRMRVVLGEAGLEVEYAVVRGAENLLPVTERGGSGRCFIAARCGGIRLIDNAPWPRPADDPDRL